MLRGEIKMEKNAEGRNKNGVECRGAKIKMEKNAEEIELYGGAACGAAGLLCGVPACGCNSERAAAEGV